MLARNKIAIVVVGLGIAVVTAYEIGTSDAVVSRTLRRELAKSVRAPCTFESASFTFLHGLEVHGLTILDPADPLGAPLLAAEHVHVDYVLDVSGAGPHVTSVEVDKPRLRIERAADGSLPAMRAFFFPTPDGPAAPKPHVHLTGGEVTFADATMLREPLALHDIDIRVIPDAGKANDWSHARVRLSATSDVLGPLTADVKVGDTGTSADVTIDLPRTRIDPSLPTRFAGEVGRKIAELDPQGEVTAHVKARVQEGKSVVAEATAELHGVSLSVVLPESAAPHPAAKPLKVHELSGHLRFADDRIEAHDLAFRALDNGAEVRADVTLDAVTKSAPTIDARVSIAALTVSERLRDFVPWAARRILWAYDITGTVDANAVVSGELSSPTVTADATITGGHVRYDGYVREDGQKWGFPWPCDDVAGKVSFGGETIRIDATGRHGPARVHVTAAIAQPPGGPSVPDVKILAEEVPLDGSLRTSFHDGGEAVFGKWGPSGIAKTVAVHVYRVAAVKDHDVIEVTLDCDGRAAFLPRILHAPLSSASGRVEILEPVVDGHLTSLVRLTNVAAQGDGYTIRVSGEVRDDGEAHAEDLVVAADTQEAGGGIRAAALGADEGTIHKGVKDAIRKLGASGPLGVVAHIVKGADGEGHDEIAVELRGTSITGWDDIPLAARGITGHALIANDTLTLEKIEGFLVMDDVSPAFTGHGRLLDLSGTTQFDVHIESPEIPLGDPLQKALGPLAKKAEIVWRDIRPVGSAHAALVLDLRPDADPTPFEITVSKVHGVLRPLGLELDNDDGTFHFDGRRAEIHGFDAAIGSAVLRIDDGEIDAASGRVTIRASMRGLRFPEDLEGPLSEETVAKIVDEAPGRTLHASDIVVVYEPELHAVEIAGNLTIKPRTRRALRDPGLSPEGTLDVSRLVFYMPENEPAFFQGEVDAEAFSLRAGLAIDRFKGPLEISGTLGAQPTFEIRTTGATLRVQEYPLTQTNALVTMKARGVHVDLKARFMDGDVEGWAGPGKGDVSYQGEFRVKAAELEQIIRMRGGGEGEVATGKISANVQFQVVNGPGGGLRGDGNIKAYEARLMQTPAIGAIVQLATLGLYTPVLTEGELKFDLDGDWLDVKDLQVTGSGVNVSIVGGEGKIGLVDGRLDLAVYPRVDLGIPVIDQIWHLIQRPVPSRQRVTGTLRNPNTQWEPVPTGAADRRRQPQPQGDVDAPARDPW